MVSCSNARARRGSVTHQGSERVAADDGDAAPAWHERDAGPRWPAMLDFGVRE